MIVLHPHTDVWPFLQHIHGVLCYRYPFTDAIQIGDHPIAIEREHASDLHFKWIITPWSNAGTHILVKSPYGSPILHFIPLEIRTRWGVVLRDPHDIATYFDPHHNAMLVEEEARKARRKP